MSTETEQRDVELAQMDQGELQQQPEVIMAWKRCNDAEDAYRTADKASRNAQERFEAAAIEVHDARTEWFRLTRRSASPRPRA